VVLGIVHCGHRTSLALDYHACDYMKNMAYKNKEKDRNYIIEFSMLQDT
jgi:hypothetical protein